MTEAASGRVSVLRGLAHTAVAGYLAKYSTKATEATGHTSRRITTDTIANYVKRPGFDAHLSLCVPAGWPGRS